MLPKYDENKPIAFESALTLISNNAPEMKTLHLNRLIINPVQQNFGIGMVEEMVTVSVIYDADLIRLAEAFKQNTTLESVVIDGTDSTRELHWTEAGAIAVGESLKDHPQLMNLVIDLQTFHLKEKQIFGFLHCLTGLAKIRHLSINVYCDSPEFLNGLGDLLLEKRESLASIHIQGSGPPSDRRQEADEEKSPSLKSFFDGIGSQRSLAYLSLERSKIGGQDWNEIADTMKGITLLKTLQFNSCGIPKNAVGPIISIAKINTELTSFDLSHNPLEAEGIESLAKALPSLRKLKGLDLSATKLTSQALGSLVSTLVEEKKIEDKIYLSSLRLASNPMNINSINQIIRLIDQNERLKSLDLSFCNITQAHIKQMKPILQDSKRCFTESLRFITNDEQSPAYIHELTDIMHKNGTICLYPGRNTPEHEVARNTNKVKRHQNKWNMFIDAVICFGQACYPLSSTSAPKLKPFNSQLFFMILAYIVPNTDGALSKGLACHALIFKNLQDRKELIKEKKYLPLALEKADLKKGDTHVLINRNTISSKWWSKGTLFVSSSVVEPYYLQLHEFIDTVKSTLKEFKIETAASTEGASVININISKTNKDRQHYLKSIFDRFFELNYGGYYDVVRVPTATLTDNGSILRLEGISLSELNNKIKKMEEGHKKEGPRCAIM